MECSELLPYTRNMTKDTENLAINNQEQILYTNDIDNFLNNARKKQAGINGIEHFLFKLFTKYCYNVEMLAFDTCLPKQTIQSILADPKQELSKKAFESIAHCYFANYISGIKEAK